MSASNTQNRNIPSRYDIRKAQKRPYQMTLFPQLHQTYFMQFIFLFTSCACIKLLGQGEPEFLAATASCNLIWSISGVRNETIAGRQPIVLPLPTPCVSGGSAALASRLMRKDTSNVRFRNTQRALLVNYEREQSLEIMRAAARRLEVWLKSNAALGEAPSRHVQDSLISAVSRAHWRTIAAAVVRTGPVNEGSGRRRVEGHEAGWRPPPGGSN
jgi:hypothetical protein